MQDEVDKTDVARIPHPPVPSNDHDTSQGLKRFCDACKTCHDECRYNAESICDRCDFAACPSCAGRMHFDLGDAGDFCDACITADDVRRHPYLLPQFCERKRALLSKDGVHASFLTLDNVRDDDTIGTRLTDVRMADGRVRDVFWDDHHIALLRLRKKRPDVAYDERCFGPPSQQVYIMLEMQNVQKCT